MNTVRVYLDFVSPYTYLALAQADRFASQYEVAWQVRPVVYGVLLDRAGLVGPVETEAKRRYTFRDVARAAKLLKIPLVGPPAHPFRSLEALRLLLAYSDDDLAMPLAQGLAAAAWGHGEDLTQTAVLARVAAAAGATRRPVAELIADTRIKLALRDNTEQAIAHGVFGVPTFEYEGELFWGHDRLPHLAARLRGELEPAGDEAGAMLARPRGADRPGAP